MAATREASDRPATPLRFRLAKSQAMVTNVDTGSAVALRLRSTVFVEIVVGIGQRFRPVYRREHPLRVAELRRYPHQTATPNSALPRTARGRARAGRRHAGER